MPSTYSPSLRLELIADNEQAGIWGQTTNRNFVQVFEESIVGVTEVNVTAGNVTLTASNGLSDESRRPYIIVTGTPVAARTVTAADVNKLYFVQNQTGQSVTIRGGAQTGVVVPAGSFAFVRLRAGLSAQQVGLLAAGAAASVSTLSVSGAATFSSSLTVDGATTLNGNMVFGNAGSDTVTFASSNITWSGNPTHSGTHTFSGLVNASLGVRAQSGAVAPFTPNAGYAFSGDSDSGMFSPADGVLQFGVNGVEAARLDGTALTVALPRIIINNDAPYFQIQETDQVLPAGRWRLGGAAGSFQLQRNTAGDGGFGTLATAMSWGASGAVGIGTANPRTDLEIASAGEVTTAFFSNDGPADAKIWRIGASGAAGRPFVIDVVNDAYSAAAAAYQIDRSGATVTQHIWFTSNGSMRLDTQGRLLLGTTSTDRRVDIVAPSGHAASVVRAQSVNRTSTNWSQAQFEAYTQAGSSVDFASIAFHVQDASFAAQVGFNGTTGRIGFFDDTGANNLLTVDGQGRDLNPNGRIRSKVSTPAFSATPTFDALAQDLVIFGTLTANVTSMTINNPAQGQFLTIRFKQDGTGNRTVAVPSGAKVSGSVGTAANQVSYLNITYNSTDARWEGSWLVVPV